VLRSSSPESIQREPDSSLSERASAAMTNTIDLGDIGTAIIEAYEAYNGDDSASAIAKAITGLSGNIADTKGGVENLQEGASQKLADASAESVGMWSRMVGGFTNVATKGSELVGTLAEYGKSTMEYAASFGYGSTYLQQAADANVWIGGWAKSTSDLISPYAYYTDLVAAGSKATTGVTDGWAVGYAMVDLDKLAKVGSIAPIKQAAELLFNIAWWKRLSAYSQGAVGAIEGGAGVFFGPLSKGITTVMTKSYETGWASYLLRAIGSSFTSAIYSNAQVAQQAEQEKTVLINTVEPIVQTGKIKDIVALCKAASDLGMGDFYGSVKQAFEQLPPGKGNRNVDRRQSFVQQAKNAGLPT
ncbi:MAG: hypothetical protein AAFR15_09500, partial [Cyanobacteria bacterium J06627_15]